MRIEKKTDTNFFEKILSGEKKFELRLADWECRPGDILVIKETHPDTGEFTGRETEKEVTYVLRTKDIEFFSKEDIEKYGFQVISFR